MVANVVVVVAPMPTTAIVPCYLIWLDKRAAIERCIVVAELCPPLIAQEALYLYP